MVTCFILTVLVQIVFRLFSCVLDEGDYVTFGYFAVVNPSVVLLRPTQWVETFGNIS